MNQNEFFNILMDGLKDLPEIKLQNIIFYYDKEFTNGLTCGKTEEEIIHELGNPNIIIDKYRNENLNNPVNSEDILIDTEITDMSNQYSIDATNSANNDNYINIDGNFTKDENIITDNNCNNIFSDSKTIDNLDTKIEDTKSNFDDYTQSNDFKSKDYHETPNLNDKFYELPNSDSESFNNEKHSEAHNSSYNSNNRTSNHNVNTILKICIVSLALMLFFPVITAIIGCVLGLFGVAISILVGSIGLLVGGTFTSFMGLPNVPMFVANFPYPVIVLFSLGSISLSIFLTLLFYYLCKLFILLLIKSYRWLKFKGGAY